ncbi:MAG: Rrf2 family transcriptional regulator [Gammaproteobacteria bacterium]|nr:Rrf2 family transcriptional regulator [Gammaproteobacteria bacterium]
MQLTLYTDYSLRTLIYLEIHGDKLSTIGEIAEFYQISRNHLVKVVHNLVLKGYIISTRGKGGGLSLSGKAIDINIADVVMDTEPHFNVVECFDAESPACTVEPVCRLKAVLGRATDAFLAELRRYTLADMVSCAVEEGAETAVKWFPRKPS